MLERTSELLLLLLLSNLGGLRLDLTGTSQRTVDFTLLIFQERIKGSSVSCRQIADHGDIGDPGSCYFRLVQAVVATAETCSNALVAPQ